MTEESLMWSVRMFVLRWDVKHLATVLRMWAEDNGYTKYDGKKKNKDSYAIYLEGNDKVQFYLRNNDSKNSIGLYDGSKLAIVLRRHGGEYVIIGKDNTDRYIEVDSDEATWSYDYAKLKELINEYPTLFELLKVRE